MKQSRSPGHEQNKVQYFSMDGQRWYKSAPSRFGESGDPRSGCDCWREQPAACPGVTERQVSISSDCIPLCHVPPFPAPPSSSSSHPKYVTLAVKNCSGQPGAAVSPSLLLPPPAPGSASTRPRRAVQVQLSLPFF